MPRRLEWDWFDGVVPDNVILHESAWIDTAQCFEQYRSVAPEAVTFGEGSAAYAPTQFDIGPAGRVRLGAYSMLNGPRIICDELIEIGDHVLISWNVVLIDTYRA